MMTDAIYKKPVLFAIVAALVILAGTIVTMFYPMLTPEMHPKLELLQPYTALQLAGKDIYQREGCNNCHTQTVRPLRTEVLRYGEYSKAGEFAFDRPFLWGSRRTGPDLARIGGKYPDPWHYMHHTDPQSMFPRSNMPKYAFLNDRTLVPRSVQARMTANAFPFTAVEIASLESKTEMDALVAYLQVIGTSVKRARSAPADDLSNRTNPRAGDAAALAAGKNIYTDNCGMCHGERGEGGIGPSVKDDVWLGTKGSISDGRLFTIIADGTESGMPPYASQLDQDQIWSLVTYLRSLQGK